MSNVTTKWNTVKLKSICNFINGNAYKDTDWSNEGVPIVRIQNLNDERKPFNYFSAPLENRVTINNEDLLLAWSGTPGTSFGAHIWNRGFALLNQHIFKVIYDKENANPIWLKYAINQILDKMIEKSHGAVGLRHVTKSEVENLEVLLPPLSEQERIVKIIETKFKAVEKLKKYSSEQLIYIDLLKTSYFNNILKNSKWKIEKLGDIGECFIGLTYSPDDINSNGIPVLRSGNIQNAKLDFSDIVRVKKDIRDSLFLQENDILICARNGSKKLIGKSAIITNLNEQMTFGAFMTIYRSQYNKFIIHFLQTQYFRNQLNNSLTNTVNQITQKTLQNIEIPLPSVDEQNHILETVNQKQLIIDKLKNTIIEQIKAVNTVSNSILRQAFQGKL